MIANTVINKPPAIANARDMMPSSRFYQGRLAIMPQDGPQTKFMRSPADIVIYGGAAGGGKSFALLLEALRNINVPGFTAVLFRRTYPMITNPGGLWDTSMEVYGQVGGAPKASALEWEFANGNSIRFAHLQHEKNKLDWMGAQIALLGFDELTHFTKGQFFYLLSRNRSACGVHPYVRATCNPAISWVGDFIAWWINQDTGFPIPERDGVLRWFVRDGDVIEWYDTKEEGLKHCPDGVSPKSVTFIKASATDNKILMRADPAYLSNLYALPMVDRMQLLEGNWKVRAIQGMFFQRAWFGAMVESKELVDRQTGKMKPGKTVRYWDRAATEESSASPDPDWTVGVKMKRIGTVFYVLDVVRFRGRPDTVLRKMKETAVLDGREVEIIMEQDPGQAGKSEISMLYREFVGYHIRAQPVNTRKQVRARPASSACEGGLVKLIAAHWNDSFLSELEAFFDPDEVETLPTQMPHDDQVDAFSGAFDALANHSVAGRGAF